MSVASLRAVLALAFTAAASTSASAQMYQLYLDCKGQLNAGKKSAPADISLALRDNNMTALVQRSNVLPVGERMKYTASQTHYTAVYTTPLRGSRVYVDWYRSWLFVWYPDFQRLVTTRLSVDRQSGSLVGEMTDARNEVLGRLKMTCEPKKDEDAQPKF